MLSTGIREYAPDHVPYIAMRLLPATLGAALVPICYLTLRSMGCRAATSLLASLLLTFENGLITQSRLILLDSPLALLHGPYDLLLGCVFRRGRAEAWIYQPRALHSSLVDVVVIDRRLPRSDIVPANGWGCSPSRLSDSQLSSNCGSFSETSKFPCEH